MRIGGGAHAVEGEACRCPSIHLFNGLTALLLIYLDDVEKVLINFELYLISIELNACLLLARGPSAFNLFFVLIVSG